MADGSVVALAAIAGALAAAAAVAAWTRTRERRLDAALRTARATLAERETAVAEAETVRRVIDAAMEEGVLLFDTSGHLRYGNRALERHLGRRPGSLAQLFPTAAAEMAADAAASRETRAGEVETASGWLRIAATPTGDGGVLVVLSDVTAARRLDAVRRDFVLNASHELKTPAASISAAAETLLDAIEHDPAAVPRFARSLQDEASRLTRIVADLLDLSRLEADGGDTADVRLDSLVTDEAGRFVERARTAGLTLTVQTERVPPIRGSERDLALLVRNLIENAIRYTPAGGSVDVRVVAEGGQVGLRVADTGIGIPQRDLPRVMERFYRVDRGRSRRSGGTGLGLSIVRHVVENHGGAVRLESEVGRGTTVEIDLPVAEASVATPGAAASATDEPHASVSSEPR